LRKSNDNLDVSNNLPIFQKVPSLPFEEESLPTEEEENDRSQELLEEEIISEKRFDLDTRQDSNKLISSNIDESNILNYSRRTALISLAPKTHHQAMKGEETDKWKEAEKKEYENMDSHKAWLVRGRKEEYSPIPLTWAFRKKLGSNNEVAEFKARICVQGFRQSFGLDYFAKYAPTGKPCSLCLLISFAVNNDIKIHQLDV
jgi:hypothetical protein